MKIMIISMIGHTAYTFAICIFPIHKKYILKSK